MGLPNALPSVQALLGQQLPTSSSRFHQRVGGHTDIIGALCPYPQLLTIPSVPAFFPPVIDLISWLEALSDGQRHPPVQMTACK